MMVKQADYQMYIEEDGRGITKTNMLKQVPVPPHGGKMHLINNIMNTMAMNLLNTIILCLFLPLDIVSQVHDTDTLCYKNDTIYQELRITRVNEKRIYFVLSSTKEDGKLTDMHKGYASISDYAYLASETDFAEDGSLYPVVEYWYEDSDISFSIRVSYDMGLATISCAESLSLPYIYKLKKK